MRMSKIAALMLLAGTAHTFHLPLRRCSARPGQLLAVPFSEETLLAVSRTDVNAAANADFMEKAPQVVGIELALALVVFIALKASGQDDRLQHYDIWGRRKNPDDVS